MRDLVPRTTTRRRSVAIAGVLALSASTVALSGSAAFADDAALATTISGSHSFSTISVVDTLDGVDAAVNVTPSISWSQPATVNVSWDPNKVRQGRHLDPTDTYTALPGGTMHLNWHITGHVGFDIFSVDLPTTDFSADGPCQLASTGSAYTCHLESSSIGLISLPPPGPYVDLKVVADVKVTPEGIASLRSAMAGDQPLGSNALTLDPSMIDPLLVPCSAGVGDELTYTLGDFANSPALSIKTGLAFDVGPTIPNPAFPIGPPWFNGPSFATPTIPVDAADTSLDLSGAGGTADLGAIQANNIPPTVATLTAPDGVEGTPIQFGATATGPCAEGASYLWSFSDGTHAFGPNPKKTFHDSGPFTGSVTVTDTTGLTGTRDFALEVANLAPAVKVLPDDPITIAWGRSLTLQAQAVDPGTDDQSTLTYAWDFGDGTPIATGGPVVTHSWSAPGTPHPSVTVCDKDNDCTTSQVALTVRKRLTSVGYTGDNAGTWSAASMLAGTVVDEFGEPVNAAALAFTLDGAPAGTAQTGAAGSGARSQVVALAAGPHLVGVSFADTALYVGNAASEPFQVGTMGTKLTYTGGLTGAPNKNTTLSAKLVDLLGRPLAGKTVTFSIGSQTTSAVTDANGVATKVLQLNQKPGYYQLTASWAGEPGLLNPDQSTLSFAINKK